MNSLKNEENKVRRYQKFLKVEIFFEVVKIFDHFRPYFRNFITNAKNALILGNNDVKLSKNLMKAIEKNLLILGKDI